MDIEELLKSVGMSAKPGNPSDEAARKVEDIVLQAAVKAGGASQATGAILQCVGAAMLPLINGMFNPSKERRASAQDRLLFGLVLAGAAIALEDEDNSISMEISITPYVLKEAFETYTKLTGKDITPFMPPSMVAFAEREQQKQH